MQQIANLGGFLSSHALSISLPSPLRGVVLFLYGGSPDFEVSFLAYMRKILHGFGYGSVAFTYRFMGDDMQCGGALHTRIEDAQLVFRHVRNSIFAKTPLVLCGISMGGYVATHLLTENSDCSAPDGLILVAPAAYSRKIVVERIPFGPDFKQILHEGKFMEETDAFDLVRRFERQVLVIRFEDDETVSEQITDAYFSAAFPWSQKNLLSGGHRSFGDKGFHRIRQCAVARVMADWLNMAFNGALRN